MRDSDLPAFWAQMSDERAQHMSAVTRGYHYDRAAFGAHWGKVRSDPVVIARTVLADGEVAATRRSSARRASGRSPTGSTALLGARGRYHGPGCLGTSEA